MINVERTFSVVPAPELVVNYLSDFARAEQWDPGTVSCTRSDDGSVRVGSTWRNVSKFRGKETELTYELTRWEQGRLTFVGKNKTATSTDDIAIAAEGSGSTITYRANIEFHGLAKLAGPFLKSEFDKLGDQTVASMTSTLNNL
ncbi:MAG: SRPBCC family protein [Actinomycetota bacterium]|nr:SRPBCC family protein [Actinomycetota bacterium]